MTYRYFPGCSLKSSGRAYEESLLAVFRALDVGLEELDDWNCCGATAYMAVDEVQAFTLAARNLALAERAGRPGPGETDSSHPAPRAISCCSRPSATCRSIPIWPTRSKRDYRRSASPMQGARAVRHPLDVLVNDIGLEPITKRVTRTLNGLKVACYYGCQIVRPFATFDRPTIRRPWTGWSRRWARRRCRGRSRPAAAAAP